KARAAGQTDRARIARDRAAALLPKLSNLIIDVPSTSRADGLEIRRDGSPVASAEWGEPIPADSGSHTIDAVAPDRKAWSQTVAVAGEAATAHVVVPDLERTRQPEKKTPIVALAPNSSPPP